MDTLDEYTWNEFIKVTRINHGWSQSETATRFGIDERTLRDWEAGRHFPNYAGLKALRVHFGKAFIDILLSKHH